MAFFEVRGKREEVRSKVHFCRGKNGIEYCRGAFHMLPRIPIKRADIESAPMTYRLTVFYRIVLMGGSSKLLPYDHDIEKLGLSIKYRLTVFCRIVPMYNPSTAPTKNIKSHICLSRRSPSPSRYARSGGTFVPHICTRTIYQKL